MLRNGLCSPATCTVRVQRHVLVALSFRRRFCATAFVCNVPNSFFRLLQLNQGGRMETGPVCSEMDSAALQHASTRHRGKYWVLSPFSAGPVQRRWYIVFLTLFREGCGQAAVREWKLGRFAPKWTPQPCNTHHSGVEARIGRSLISQTVLCNCVGI